MRGKGKWVLRNKNKRINSQIIQDFLSHGKECVFILRMTRIQYRSNKIGSAFWKVPAGSKGRRVDRKGAKLEAGTLFKTLLRDFSGGPVVKTLRSQCRGPRFNPW